MTTKKRKAAKPKPKPDPVAVARAAAEWWTTTMGLIRRLWDVTTDIEEAMWSDEEHPLHAVIRRGYLKDLAEQLANAESSCLLVCPTHDCPIPIPSLLDVIEELAK